MLAWYNFYCWLAPGPLTLALLWLAWKVRRLSKIARVDTVGHGPECICTACRLRRELEDK